MKKYPKGTGVYYVYYDPNTNEASANYYEVLNAIEAGAFPVMVAVQSTTGNVIYIPVCRVSRTDEALHFVCTENGDKFILNPEGWSFIHPV